MNMNRSKQLESPSKYKFELLDPERLELVAAETSSLESTDQILENRKVYKLVQILDVPIDKNESVNNISIHSKEGQGNRYSFVVQVNQVDLMTIEEEQAHKERLASAEVTLTKTKNKRNK